MAACPFSREKGLRWVCAWGRLVGHLRSLGAARFPFSSFVKAPVSPGGGLPFCPFLWTMGAPLLVPPLPGWNVRGYSYLERTQEGDLHPGADLNVGGGDDDLGLDVVSCASGVVVARRAWDAETYGYGNRLLVAHQVAEFRFWGLYAHLDAFDGLVVAGASVEVGQRLGACGLSGFQRWAHLHFEARYQGPPEVDVDYWGGRLAIEQLSERYADPFTLFVVAPHLAVSPLAGELDCSAVQVDRDYNYALKMAMEAYLRSVEGRRVRLKPGTTDRLIASVRR